MSLNRSLQLSRLSATPKGSAGLIFSTLFLLLTGFVLGCGEGAHHFPHKASVLEHIEQADTVAFDSLSSEDLLQGITPVAVEGFAEVPSFSVAERTGQIKNYPCQSCHTASLEVLQRQSAAGKKAHWSVAINHAGAEVMTCLTCHAEENLDDLKQLSGKPLAFDHSYQQCAQCHSTQANDWAGGAHGKRLAGWVPPRVVTNCTGCHDPHSPAFASRFPARASRLASEEE